MTRGSELVARARRDHQRFDPPDQLPDEDLARRYLRRGVAPAIATYIEARSGSEMVRFSPVEFDQLERAMNLWLELYTRCYGVELDAQFTVRTAAELLLETHDITDVAQLVTDVPSRQAGRR